MYELMVEDYFSGAHNLREYNGNCEKLHGHNWKIRIVVCTDTLDSLDIGIDFRDLKRHLKEVLDLMDHKYLNELDFFKKNNPTTENISKFIYTNLKDKLKKYKNSSLKKVISWEEVDAGAAYYE
ncbi:MAG: 6-carboxytetrahydropterin synthase QueD [Spirochaetes bacterium]|nr:6-carboxytetrahydropterin synthase QueD [Spirochaetota bacterium]